MKCNKNWTVRKKNHVSQILQTDIPKIKEHKRRNMKEKRKKDDVTKEDHKVRKREGAKEDNL